MKAILRGGNHDGKTIDVGSATRTIVYSDVFNLAVPGVPVRVPERYVRTRRREGDAEVFEVKHSTAEEST